MPASDAEMGPDRLFSPLARYSTGSVRRVWVLEWGRNPSTDYYIVPRCSAAESIPYELVDVTRTDPATLSIPPGTYIVIVRYVTGPWLRRLRADRDRLAGVAYFMDDDLPAAVWNAALPARYRYKIFRNFYIHRRSLSALCSEIWVSCPYLAGKYRIAASHVLAPLPLADEPPQRAPKNLTYFYEGTASHGAEFEWLREVVGRVQRETDELTFLTVGDAAIRRIFAGIPRIVCIHPVDWPTYRGCFPCLRHDVGLAPLLDGDFNRARAPTKFYDITRVGAAGIYSNTAPYADFVRSGEDGWLVDNVPAAWSDAIIRLARSTAERARLVGNARQRVARSRAEAQGLPAVAENGGLLPSSNDGAPR